MRPADCNAELGGGSRVVFTLLADKAPIERFRQFQCDSPNNTLGLIETVWSFEGNPAALAPAEGWHPHVTFEKLCLSFGVPNRDQVTCLWVSNRILRQDHLNGLGPPNDTAVQRQAGEGA